jgi:hypothetical protein
MRHAARGLPEHGLRGGLPGIGSARTTAARGSALEARLRAPGTGRRAVVGPTRHDEAGARIGVVGARKAARPVGAAEDLGQVAPGGSGAGYVAGVGLWAVDGRPAASLRAAAHDLTIPSLRAGDRLGRACGPADALDDARVIGAARALVRASATRRGRVDATEQRAASARVVIAARRAPERSRLVS